MADEDVRAPRRRSSLLPKAISLPEAGRGRLVADARRTACDVRDTRIFRAKFAAYSLLIRCSRRGGGTKPPVFWDFHVLRGHKFAADFPASSELDVIVIGLCRSVAHRSASRGSRRSVTSTAPRRCLPGKAMGDDSSTALRDTVAAWGDTVTACRASAREARCPRKWSRPCPPCLAGDSVLTVRDRG